MLSNRLVRAAGRPKVIDSVHDGQHRGRVSWTVVATVVGSAVTTLAGVIVGGLVGRHSQDRHWLRDTKAASYRNLLREYTRIEFDVRRAYLGQLEITELDWARWGAALTELGLVADEEAAAAAQRIADVVVRMDRYVHSGAADDDHWRGLLGDLTIA